MNPPGHELPLEHIAGAARLVAGPQLGAVSPEALQEATDAVGLIRQLLQADWLLACQAEDSDRQESLCTSIPRYKMEADMGGSSVCLRVAPRMWLWHLQGR